MKTTNTSLLTIFSAIALSLNLHAQNFWEWLEPVALTDSTSDNSNAYLKRFWDDQGVFMVWEKHIDSLSTAIYFRNIIDGSPAELVLADPGIHYTNPKILSANQYPPTDSVFYLFYETNQNGSQDIYYTIYLTDGSFQPPVAFAISPYDDIELDVAGNAFMDGKYIKSELVWTSNGKIYNSSQVLESGQQYFTDAVVIDSVYCSNPQFNDWSYDVYYLKMDTSGKKYVHRAYRINNEWHKQLVFDDGDCENLNSDNLFSSYTIWSSFIDSTWKLVINDYLPFYIFDIEKDTPFDPGIIANGIIVEQGAPYEYVHIAFPYPANDQEEIFMNPDPYGTTFEDFTNSGVENRNAEFFLGEDETSSCFYIYLTWESKRNGYWQIWSSKKILCIGAIEENDGAASFLGIQPNPFNNETTLRFTIDSRSDVSIDIYNNSGVYVSTLANKSFDQGTHQLRWNAEGHAAGIYVVKMRVDDKIYTSKLIKH